MALVTITANATTLQRFLITSYNDMMTALSYLVPGGASHPAHTAAKSATTPPPRHGR